MMKQYDSYKDSGVEWIGKIPSHWNCVRLKFYSGPLKSGGTPKSDDKRFYSSEGTPWVAISDMSSTSFIYDTEKHLTKEGIQDKNLVIYPEGTLLYSIYATLGKVSELKVPACINQAILAISPKSAYDKVYFKYCLQTQEQYVFSLSNGNTQNNLNAEKVANFNLVLPPISEQQIIANYLDEKCGELDKAIATQEKRVELLKELRLNIITQAVTRGINPDAPLKDSGVEWIGEVPEHWEVMKMGLVCNVITDYVASGSFADLKKNVEYLDMPDYAMLVRTADLSNKNRDIQRVYVSKDAYKFLSNSNLYGGEIILPNIGASIGDVYMVPGDLYEKMTLAPNSIMVKTNYFDLYFYYYFSSICGRKSLELIGLAAAQGKFNKTELRQMRVPVPPLSEQQEIVSYIESKTARLDASIEKAEHQIELLQELKQSIITEVVTGKRKVV